MKIDLRSGGPATFRKARTWKARFDWNQMKVSYIAIAALLLGSLFTGTSRASEASRRSLPVTHDLRSKYALFSWMGTNGTRRFALLANNTGSEEHRFIDSFDARRTPGLDIRRLEYQLAKLPPHCLVGWMKDRPHKLDHADPATVRRLKKFTAQFYVDLQFNEMTYESIGVR